MPTIAIGLALIVVLGCAAALRRARHRAGNKREAFNCCEHCGAALPRDRDQPWRYRARCARCHRIQTWADQGPTGA